ncbi:DUF3667 domain-containing protein [Sphingomonas lenta]|uniref:DUF3667 domain-containing protein n=1 Tax=Sphingomonas lenta TaxID=1141887 RepID=A0A2A2SG01_9SPHN|nr:DUF3667 domain-containing protein [Sphingomonas lenta]PAX08120.1 hypothetical protein CKY28_11075 [Sphingomonas lenta]
MSGEIAAAGDMMTGALTARAVEPHAGEAHGPGGALCLNCGTKLIGEHCHRCGQSGHVHRTVGAIGHELAHGVLHFEGKIWRTLPMLAFRPGELTRRYVAGERARFVSPLALFLFSVFLMFAVMSNIPGLGAGDADKTIASADFDEARAKLAEERLNTQATLKRHSNDLTEERRKTQPDVERVAKLEKRIVELRANEQRILNAQRFLPPPDAAAADPDKANSWLEQRVRQAQENPKLLAYKMKTSAYKYSWALIPISLPFIWLLFPFRRDVGLYDHAVFATYSLSFMSILVVVLSLLAAIGAPDGLLVGAAMLIPPFHLYQQLKGAYRLTRAGALWRTGWMIVFATFTSTLFTIMLAVMGTLD